MSISRAPRPLALLVAAAGVLLCPAPGTRSGEAETPKPKSGYELFLEKGRIVDFPARSWDQAFAYNSQCYAVRTDTSADVAEYAGVLMDAVHYYYCQRFGVQGTRRANIAVFRTKEEMFEFAKTRCKWTPPAASIGFFSTVDGGTICVPWKVLSGEKPEATLMHEGAHQFANAVFGNALPTWLDEGFAVYFENSRFDGRNLDMGRIPAGRLRQLQGQMKSGKHVTLEKLFATKQEQFGVECYGAAWAFVFWLAHAGDAREINVHQQSLAQFVADCRQGKKDGKVLAVYLGRQKMEHLEKEWKEWVLALDPADPYGGIRPLEIKDADARAVEALRKLCDHLAGLSSLKVEASATSVRTGTGGPPQEAGATCALAMRRPNLLSIEMRGSAQELLVVSDGRKLQLQASGDKKTVTAAAPADMDGLLGEGQPAARALRAGGMGLLAALLHKRPWNALAEGTASLRHGGMESAGGAMCHRLKFVRQTGAFDLWVRDGDKPAVMKMTAEISAAPVGTTPATAVKTGLTVTFSNWEPNAIIPDEAFKPRAQ